MVVDCGLGGLQRSRILLYKSRMDSQNHPLRTQLFSSLGDATQLLHLFDFLPNIYLYVKDRRGRFAAMNRHLVELRGAEQESELLGKTDLELHPVHWGRMYQEEDRKVMESGREIPDQVWLVPDPEGQLRSYVSSKIPLRDHEENIIGIAGVMYPLETPQNVKRDFDPIQAATELIHDQFSQPLEISSISERVRLSSSQLNRRFRAVYQMSPSQYLQRVRVHHASVMLADTELQVGTVALESGFYDQAHLTRMFRRWYGMTPTEFRNEARPSNTRP